MTRRIALAILASVWLSLILGGVVVYWMTRTIMLAELDATLLRQAAALPEAGGANAARPAADDRFLIRNEQGQTIARAAPAEGAPAPRIVHAAFATLGDGHRVRTLTLQQPASDEQAKPITIIYSGSAEAFDRVLNRLAFALVILGAMGGLGGALVAMRVARAALRPLLGTAEQFGQIDEGQLSRRIPSAGLPDELRPVAERINEMLGRLEIAFNRRKQFFADTSHELRTPIAAMITTLEVALRRPRPASELQTALERALVDARTLNHLGNSLLEQARSEGAPRPAVASAIDSVALLTECAESVRPLADERQLKLELVLPNHFHLRTDETRLRSIVVNLLSNAIEYNRPGGWVRLSARTNKSDAIIEVQDTGIGISPEDLEQVFEPFYRASKSRSESGHMGLGLHLVKTHAAALGGRCVADSTVGQGSRFTLTLPDVTAENPVEREISKNESMVSHV